MTKATQEFYELAKGQGELIGEIRGIAETQTKMLRCYVKAGNSLEDAFNLFEITDEEEQDKFRKLITV